MQGCTTEDQAAGPWAGLDSPSGLALLCGLPDQQGRDTCPLVQAILHHRSLEDLILRAHDGHTTSTSLSCVHADHPFWYATRVLARCAARLLTKAHTLPDALPVRTTYLRVLPHATLDLDTHPDHHRSRASCLGPGRVPAEGVLSLCLQAPVHFTAYWAGNLTEALQGSPAKESAGANSAQRAEEEATEGRWRAFLWRGCVCALAGPSTQRPEMQQEVSDRR